MAEQQVRRKINKPPIFSGIRKDLKGFLTIVDLNFENDPDSFPDDRSKTRFIISYLAGDPLDWAANLRDNNDPLLENLADFRRELRENYGFDV